uniref:Uncharacterized protein n=1 Tax=Ciona savignyi TaxID=51511 RepID=H2YUL8_CIOSA
TPVSVDILQTFDVFTKFVVELIGQHLGKLAVARVFLAVQEPIWDLILAQVLHNGDNTVDFVIR